jgi:hypothetical protein
MKSQTNFRSIKHPKFFGNLNDIRPDGTGYHPRTAKTSMTKSRSGNIPGSN